MSDALTIGQVIRSWRETRGLSRAQVRALLAGAGVAVTEGTIGRWETDGSPPRRSSLLALLRVFGIIGVARRTAYRLWAEAQADVEEEG